MCTAITLQNARGDQFFGRNMDFSHEIDPHLFTVPQGHFWRTQGGGQVQDKYSFLGIGQQVGELLAFFDGVNEKGFAAAALYFAGYAAYVDVRHIDPKNDSVAAFEFLHYLLGRCASVKDLYSVVNTVSVIGVDDPVTRSIAPLHWIATDKSGVCVVMEMTKDGFYIFPNEIGVMANSPDFMWHMTNLRNYTQVTPEQKSAAEWGEKRLKPFGQGAGSFPLPGGFTSPERFVRTAFLKTHIPQPKTKPETVGACFHIMKSVSIPKGAVTTDRGVDDYTKYTAFIDTDACVYYFNTYENQQILNAEMCKTSSDGAELVDMGSIYLPIVFPRVGNC